MLQVDLVIKLLRKHLQDRVHHWVEVSTEAQHTLNQELQDRLKKTVWLQGGCKSWYLTTLSHNSTSNGKSQIDSGKQGPLGGVVDAAAREDGVRRVAKAGEMQQAGSSKGGGAVMWPGLCTEFWWRTRRPVDKAWMSGRVESHQ
jgi:hypothetical protein